MHKLRKAAVLVAALSSVGLLGAGTAHADGGHGGQKKDGDRYNVLQSSNCKSHDLNLDLLGNVGILNGLLGVNDEGNPGAQDTHVGSTQGCNNSAW
ncbi:hypothetical protein AB0D27_20750 [Streptomyces sp. NPDC048415]|jgi:hypothetical protein|uniref:hypothetical protein n=1 Tax=Streptomyces sp. NPDC048415 TaxID=3154822 RepID=UPI0034323211